MMRRYLKYYTVAVLLIYLASSVGLNIFAHHCACTSSETFSLFSEANWHDDHHHADDCHEHTSHSCCDHNHGHTHGCCDGDLQKIENHSHKVQENCTDFHELVQTFSSYCFHGIVDKSCSTSHIYVRVLSYASSHSFNFNADLPIISLLFDTFKTSEELYFSAFTEEHSTPIVQERITTLERIYLLQCPKIPSSNFLI